MPSSDMTTLDDVIKYLNGLIACDAAAMRNLVESRVPCNDELVNHPTAIVIDGAIGALGVINGMFGLSEKGGGKITAVFDDEDHLLRFERSA